MESKQLRYIKEYDMLVSSNKKNLNRQKIKMYTATMACSIPTVIAGLAVMLGILSFALFLFITMIDLLVSKKVINNTGNTYEKLLYSNLDDDYLANKKMIEKCEHEDKLKYELFH